MAAELAVAGITTGSTVVAQIRRDSDEEVWHVSNLAFETYSQPHQTAGAYDVVLTEQGTSGYYVGDMPSDITSAGYYNITFLTRTGTTPTFTYTTETAGTINWDGSGASASPSGLNWVTRAAYKTFAGITDTDSDALIDQLLPQASVLGNQYVDRAVKSVNLTETYPGYCGGGRPYLHLRSYPLTSITSITFDYLSDAPTVVAGSEFTYDEQGMVWFKPSSTATSPYGSYFSGDFTKVIYVAGYTSVPQDLQLACCLIVQRLMQLGDPDVLVTEKAVKDVKIKYDASVAVADAIPAAAKQILDAYKEQVLL